MNQTLQNYLDNPLGFSSTQEDIRSHDPECKSLKYVWMPRTGGVTALGDIADCQRCEVTFYWEGLHSGDFDDCPRSNHWYCACCLPKVTVCCHEEED